MPNKVKDLTGQRFGRLTVIKRCGSTNTKHKVALWLCKCDCGNEVKRTGSHLQANYTNSCGSCPDLRPDLTGRKYGRWTVLEKAEKKHRKISYLCKCECGTVRVVTADTLEELADMIGVPADALVETVNKYNSYVDNGEDPETGRTLLVSKITDGPFFAAKRVPSAHHTMGGVHIDTETHVLDKEQNIIESAFQKMHETCICLLPNVFH